MHAYDPTVFHRRNAVAEFVDARIVRDDDHGATVLHRDFPQEFHDGVACAGVQRGSRFVEHQQSRRASHGPGDGDGLALTAGKLTNRGGQVADRGANFRKPASKLSAYEAARLAVMLPRPKYFEKLPNSAYLSSRAATIMARMGDAVVP